jgi:hypothetical protein
MEESCTPEIIEYHLTRIGHPTPLTGCRRLRDRR